MKILKSPKQVKLTHAAATMAVKAHTDYVGRTGENVGFSQFISRLVQKAIRAERKYE